MSTSDSELKCDGPACAADATMECACRRCVRESRAGFATEAFHACAAHRADVELQHQEVRGYHARWCGVTAGSRAVQ